MSDSLPRRRSNCRLVVDLEGEGREVLGEYRTTEEDSVSYWTEEDGTLVWAPEDCVAIVPGYRERPGLPAYEVEPEPLTPEAERAAADAILGAGGPRELRRSWGGGLVLEVRERPFPRELERLEREEAGQ